MTCYTAPPPIVLSFFPFFRSFLGYTLFGVFPYRRFEYLESALQIVPFTFTTSLSFFLSSFLFICNSFAYYHLLFMGCFFWFSHSLLSLVFSTT